MARTPTRQKVIRKKRRRGAARAAPAAKAPRKKKFPIKEILTGIVILFIIVSGSKNTVSEWLNTRNVDQAAEDLYYNLVWARESAVANKKNAIIRFNPADREYIIYLDRNEDKTGQPEEEIRRVHLDETVQFSTNASFEVPDVWNSGTLGHDPVVFQQAKGPLMFNPLGGASAETALYLTPTADIGVRPDYMRALQVSRATGFVQPLKYSAQGEPHWE